MLQAGMKRYERPPVCLRSLGIESWKDALFVTVLLTVTTAGVVLGIGLQIAPASRADGSRAREIEALLASIRQASARCISAPRGEDGQVPTDARSP